MFRLPFKVYGAVTALKHFNEIKQNEKFLFQNLKLFMKFCHPPTRHINNKSINFAPCNKPIMANMLLLTNLERFLRRINSPPTR